MVLEKPARRFPPFKHNCFFTACISDTYITRVSDTSDPDNSTSPKRSKKYKEREDKLWHNLYLFNVILEDQQGLSLIHI